MRSLFLRIFLSFLGATLLIGGVLVVLALTADPHRAEFIRHEERLTNAGNKFAAAYREGGAEALRASVAEEKIGRGTGAVILFRNGIDPLDTPSIPRKAAKLAAKAAATGQREIDVGKNGLWIALPLDEDYVLVAELQPPSDWQRFTDPYGLGLRLLSVFLIVVGVSWFLARSLSGPIRKLRHATQELAKGNLSVRVAPSLGGRFDETAQLGRDFDLMAERIETLLTSQRRLLRDISHELRSPLARLNVALGIARPKAGSEATLALDRIEREAEVLNELIGHLLTLASLEAGEIGERALVPLQLLVREVSDDADFEAKGRGCGVRVAEDSPLFAEGSQTLLHSAVENVIRNAVRFTKEGSEVEVRLRRKEGGETGLAVVSVRDFGPGVPESALENLFEPFYRVAEARDRQSGGAGIGLAITKRAISLHNGRVKAFNAPGGGLEVTIELPLAKESSYVKPGALP
ncbi:HAMP domain-containing protein [bacterium]|nr:MAG: HAMP domain-containing protein [bacterium]